MGQLKRFPTTKTDPKLLLHQLLEHVDEIEDLVVGIKWKGGVLDTHWTNQKSYGMCALVRYLQIDADNMLREGRGEE